MAGLVERLDDAAGEYWDILAYDRPLSDKEIAAYELDYIQKVL
jgi:hypothetical protein